MNRRVFGVGAGAVAALVALGSSQLVASYQATATQGRGQSTGAGTPQNPLTPQNPIRDSTAQQTTGTGEISGTVTLEGSGVGVRRAQVMLNAQVIRGQRTLITDDHGRFSFTALPAGRYTLQVSKPGYVSTSYGAKKPGRPGTPIQLGDAQKFTSASVSVPKGSVITGTVIDEGNEPTPGTQVRAFQYVLRTGEKTLQQAGSASTDDRGVYRIYGLQPGDYLVSATPRNMNMSDVRQAVMSQVEQLLQQAQAANAADAQQGPNGGGGGGRGGGGGAIANLAGRAAQQPGGRGQAFIDQATALQQQLAQQEKEQTVGYAPVYYPGTTNSAASVPITLTVGEERAGIDMQLQQVPTAIVSGTLASPDGRLPQGTQLMLRPVTTSGSPLVPGLAEQAARVLADGTFAFSNVAPGQYTVSARAMLRESDPTQANAPAANGRGGRAFGQGPGGRGGPGIVTSVLWASADINVNGQSITGIALTLASGLTVSGHVEFHGTTLPVPTDLTRVRVNITAQDAQTQQDFGGSLPPATVDANGTFTIPGVPPGHYVLRGNAAAGVNGARGGATSATVGNWTLKSSIVNGRDSLDFPFEVKPGNEVTNAVLSFVDRTQVLRGTLQDATGRPTADYTIIVFSADKTFWTPQSRRITSTRPGTDGTYSISNLPPGDYRIAAVVDVEQGEWFDPAFLAQLLSASTPVSLSEGDTKVQDLRLAGGG
jgi:uncharacterized protein (DUF2141 family)